jgi:hypothetical protein
MSDDRLTTKHYVYALLVAVFLLAVTCVIIPVKASATAEQQASCVAAHTDPQGVDAGQCRDHGWTVKGRLVVGPNGWVKFSRITHCYNEDGSGQIVLPCSWNFTDGDGNGKGLSYWLSGTSWRHQHVHYVHVGDGADVR